MVTSLHQTTNLSRLSLVIPTINRGEFLKRQITYWQEHPITLIIGDGSDHPLILDSSQGHVRLRYEHSRSSLQDRMVQVSKRVDTEFVALCSDDDLYLPSGLSACIDRLDSDQKLVGCVGKSLQFSRRGQELFFRLINFEKQDSSHMFSDGLERVRNTYYPGKLDNQIYGVYRAEQWRSSVATAYSQSFAAATVYEFILLLLIPYSGDVALENALTWMSSAENSSVMQSAGYTRKFNILNWFDNPEYQAEVLGMIELIVGKLSSSCLHDPGKVEAVVRKVTNEFCERYREKKYLRKRISIQRAIRGLLPYSPELVKRAAKNHLPSFLRNSIGFGIFPFSSLERILYSADVHFSLPELEKFQDIVRTS